MKIALVYDRVNKWGGAERVLLALHEIWPKAPLYTAVYNRHTASWAKVFKVIPSFLNRISFFRNHHEILPFLTPMAFSQFDFSQFDVVLSVTSAEAKNLTIGSKTLHVCYCLTPTRYLWSHSKEYQKEGLKGKILSIFLPSLRKNDLHASKKVDQFLAISNQVKQRIKKYYQRESKIIYPPVDLNFSKLDEKIQDHIFYLVVSRLVPYKRIDLAIKACNKLSRNLIIIGTGSEEAKLKNLAGKTVKFLGYLTDKELYGYYKHCRALLFPGEEDFGITPVEAQSFGAPVIAYGKGGLLETVINGKTGLFFSKQTEKSLIEAILKFEQMKLEKEDCIKNSQKFNKSRFKKEIEAEINLLYKQFLEKKGIMI
ncbi:glycosyltransferase family 4 protein [Candidatus Beckwithbacteria bacterium]|nr:glycosyltransferase family 4 protein [Candidatus Beckwithbacteria bacterium]